MDDGWKHRLKAGSFAAGNNRTLVVLGDVALPQGQLVLAVRVVLAPVSWQIAGANLDN